MWFVTTVVATLCVHAIKARVTGNGMCVVRVATWAALLALVAVAAVLAGAPGWRVVALAASLPLVGVVVINQMLLSAPHAGLRPMVKRNKIAVPEMGP